MIFYTVKSEDGKIIPHRTTKNDECVVMPTNRDISARICLYDTDENQMKFSDFNLVANQTNTFPAIYFKTKKYV